MRIDTTKVLLLLAEQGITKTVLAERSGICRQNISMILGRGTCTPASVGKLAKGLGVEPMDIIKKEED